MQTILENSSKIMIDSQANNNMLYLPLDKIIQQVSRGNPDPNAAVAAAASSTASGSAKAAVPAKKGVVTSTGGLPNPYDSGTGSGQSPSSSSRYSR
ncbi:hypothetical protein D9M72_609610 [compost metagenome]